MDFFGAQDKARKKTWQLAALFVVAVLCLVVLTNLLVGAVYTWTARPAPTGGIDFAASPADLPPAFWLGVSLAVVAVVALASGYKYLQVRGGGRAIAESLGGELVHRSNADYRVGRLLNVVEEMAIASGAPVPPVYLIDEPSINAFAAGFGPDDAVIGINRGTLEHLDREELQGVVGHEFSHILNGDSRLNLRLIAVLHGILFIGLVGRGLLYGLGRGRHRSGRSSGGAPALALGLGLLVIGYAGTFFGNLIKAAVSRQREYLADAASVQFTRNPRGIAGALKKIGGHADGSRMPSAAAGEASHLFFGQVGRLFLNSLMATHPPLERRIRAVDPRWDGVYPVVSAATAEAGTAPAAARAFSAATGSATAGDALEIHASPDEVAEAVGRLDAQALAAAGALIDGLPVALRDAAHDPFASRALLHAMLLDSRDAVRRRQLDHLAQAAEPGLDSEVQRLESLLANLDAVQRLVLVEMAMPALKELSQQQYRAFTTNLVTLIKADQRIDLLEWVLHRLLVKELRPHFEGPRKLPVRHGTIEAVAGEAVVLLSALAREGRPEPEHIARAFETGIRALGIGGELTGSDDPDFARLNRALSELRALNPLQKPRLVKACAATVLADDHVSAREGALLQGVAAALDCPLPPSIYRARR